MNAPLKAINVDLDVRWKVSIETPTRDAGGWRVSGGIWTRAARTPFCARFPPSRRRLCSAPSSRSSQPRRRRPEAIPAGR